MSRFGFEEKADKLVRAFKHFEIDAKVVAVMVSKSIVTFEFVTYKRQKILEILNLAEKIRYFAGEDKLRVVLSGYGENHFGVEVPIADMGDQKIEELYKATTFNNSNMILPIYIGTDTHNRILYDDLYCISNLLVAGNSGVGKTAFLNSVIANIIMSKGSNETKLIIFDPKGCEWEWVEGLSHVECSLTKGLKDGNKKITQLIEELEHRQELFATAGRKNIIDYNENEPAKIPHLVVIFDELFDYLMLGDADFEKALARLMMRGRAAGIHFIIATTHTTDRVITPIIKAHFLAQMAFYVDTAEESELILDIGGSEHLCRVGDAFYKSPYHPIISRITSANMPEIVVKTIVPKNHKPKANNFEVDKLCEDALNGILKETSERQIVQTKEFRKMMKHCLEMGTVSTGLLQINFDIGYGKAAKYCDIIKKVLGMTIPEKISVD